MEDGCRGTVFQGRDMVCYLIEYTHTWLSTVGVVTDRVHMQNQTNLVVVGRLLMGSRVLVKLGGLGLANACFWQGVCIGTCLSR